MKNIFLSKKIFFAAALFALRICAANSLDFGGSFLNFTRAKGKDFSNLKFNQINDALGWIRVPLSKDGSSYFAAQALYEFEYDASVEKAYNRLDINLAKYVGLWNVAGSPLTLSAGRFIFSDLTGLVMSQNCDGVHVSYQMDRVSFSAYAGYTGLLNAAIVKMQSNAADPFEYDSDKVYQLAQKYLVASAGVSVPNLFSTQTLSGQFLAAFKLEGKSFNRIYATLDMTGPIYRRIYYSASTTLGLQNYDGGSTEVTNLSRAEVKYYAPFKDLSVAGGLVYASGNGDGDNAFTGFTKINSCFSMNEMQYTSLVKIYAAASVKPIKKVLAKAGAALLFNTARGRYQGFDYNFGADWQIKSDAAVGATFNHYVDGDDSGNSKVQISLNAFLTF